MEQPLSKQLYTLGETSVPIFDRSPRHPSAGANHLNYYHSSQQESISCSQMSCAILKPLQFVRKALVTVPPNYIILDLNTRLAQLIVAGKLNVSGLAPSSVGGMPDRARPCLAENCTRTHARKARALIGKLSKACFDIKPPFLRAYM